MDQFNLNTDTPVSQFNQDKFQRAPFAQRISHLIKNYTSNDSLTVGIYGKWGEGKSSVLNLIERDLEESNDTVIVKFNPWLFNNESQILISFFQTLAAALSRSLETRGEKLGKFLREYSSIIGTIGSITGIPNSKSLFSRIGKKLSDKSVEDRRKAINTILKEAKTKVIIMIDDIDRLNNLEIQSIFRLVKLTADFNNTIYVLAFDDKRVAESLSSQYPMGGQDFLEKIIQVPLRLPKAQKSALKNYTIKHLNRVLEFYKIDIHEDEIYRFVSLFDKYYLPYLDNPRVAVRYANSIQFSIPMLLGEVNVVDLLVLEGIKIIYPDLYNYLRDNPTIFTKNYSIDFTYGIGTDRRLEDDQKNAKAHLESFISNSYPDRQKVLLDLIQDLFPQFKGVFGNHSFSENSWRKWYAAKRICSGRYFSRYFTYTVLQGEISDIFFDGLLNRLSIEDFSKKENELIELFKDLEMEELLLKFQFLEEEITGEQAILLASNLSFLGELYPNPKQFFTFYGPYPQMANFLGRLIHKCPERLGVANRIISKAKPIDFACEIWKRMHREPGKEQILDETEFRECTTILIERVKKEIPFEAIYDKLSDGNAMYLMQEWSKIDTQEIRKLNNDLLKDEESYFLKLLYMFSSTIISSSHPEPYKSYFNQSYYASLNEVVDMLLMYDRSIQIFGQKEAPVNQNDREPITDDELIGLFQKTHINNVS